MVCQRSHGFESSWMYSAAFPMAQSFDAMVAIILILPTTPPPSQTSSTALPPPPSHLSLSQICSLQLQTQPFLNLSIANSYPTFLTYPSSIHIYKLRTRALLSIQEFPPNALRQANEFVIGLLKSWDGNETPQSNKVRSITGRLTVRAAERGWRVYLQYEHETSTDATYMMINLY
ncbi:hypothetical protein DITRI_Ditri13aG0019300 [Diplodiscus trichospermus]